MTQPLNVPRPRLRRPGRKSASTPGWRTSRQPCNPRRREGATDMSATDNFWRDLVSFTWNMQTVEGVKASLTTSPRLGLTWPGRIRTT